MNGSSPTGGTSRSAAPFVSVMMAAYDAERYVVEAVQSVLAQDYPAFELLVVDDGSSDGTCALLEGITRCDSRVRVLRNDRNLGIVATRNRLLAEAHPEARYLAVLDADDACLPGRLARQVAFLEAHPHCAAVGSHIVVIDEQGREVGRRRYPTTAEQIRRVITRFNPIAQPAVMIRRTAIDAVGPYDARYPRCQDYELWLRLAARYDLANLDEPLIRYRISTTQGKRTHLRESLRLTIDIQRRFLFEKRFWNPVNVGYWVLEHGLLWVPEPWVLAAFKGLRYGSAQAR